MGRLVSYERRGSGPPLVLVHGSFSDHRSNWEFVQPLWARDFTSYAIARPGRGGNPPAPLRDLEDDARDVVALIQAIPEPAFLLGHSFGAHVALAAAAMVPALVRRLILYEPPWTSLVGPVAMAPLEALADSRNWDAFSYTFFRDVLLVPVAELDELRASPLWPPDRRRRPRVPRRSPRTGPLSLSPGFFRASPHARPPPDRHGQSPALLRHPRSRRRLPDARIAKLEGQAHEAMTTDPELYAAQVRSFLQEDRDLGDRLRESLRTMAF